MWVRDLWGKMRLSFPSGSHGRAAKGEGYSAEVSQEIKES